jgi:hypothetical protein
MHNWFLAKVKCIREDDKGSLRKFTDQYMVDALSFTEAEAKVHNLVKDQVRGEFEVSGLTKSNVTDVFQYSEDEYWYKSKVTYLVQDADSGKDKLYNLYMMVSATDLKNAYERLDDNLQGMINNPRIVQIQETSVMGVIWNESKEEEVIGGSVENNSIAEEEL